MSDDTPSYRARKALMVHIGEEAGSEIADLISSLVSEVEELRRTKVDIADLAGRSNPDDDLTEKTN